MVRLTIAPWDLTDQEHAVLMAALAQNGREGETLEEFADRVALKTLRVYIDQAASAQRSENLRLVTRQLDDPAIETPAKIAALEALGLTYDGTVVTEKDAGPIDEEPVDEPPVEAPIDAPAVSRRRSRATGSGGHG